MIIYKALVVDDEVNNILLIKHFINKYCQNIQIVGEAATAGSAISLINELEPDILLLDIWLHGKDIFDMLDLIKIPRAQVLFVTSHEEYAVNASRYVEIDYILKPIIIEELIHSVSKSILKIEKQQYFDFRKGSEIARIKKRSI
ncbi:response regulator [Flavobacterium sp. GSB-24]|uniref:LytR/AlgR family response regulator transcription factor n=1 Tax=Flavobacterium sp. GSB-24 TaxID=2994319 RepID=UPI0024931B9E|nr:response regulator [Flavobacterium sp. GSB-24]BDU26939.1 hypothetical protein FLGSB24_36830 [Flavobacterium sp. GSB-24]